MTRQVRVRQLMNQVDVLSRWRSVASAFDRALNSVLMASGFVEN